MSTGKTKRKKNLLVDHPAWERLSKEWDWEKNDEMGIKPDEVTAGSHKKAAWRCEKGHEWEAVVNNRVGKGCGCPYCTHQKFAQGVNDIATECPELIVDWDMSANKVKPDEVLAGGCKKWSWKCHVCGYEWKASVKVRRRGHGCPACAHQVFVPGINDLQTELPELAQEWSDEENGIPASAVIAGGAKSWTWRCQTCHNTWRTTINARRSGQGCPVCSYKKRAEITRTPTDGIDDLLSQFPDVAAEWHPTRNGDLTPDQVRYGSERAVWWFGKCGHEWDMPVRSRIQNGERQGQGCPYCAGKRVQPGWNDLASQYPVVSASWHPTRNGELSPEGVTPKSSRRVWWSCPECNHEWQATVASRTDGCGCPKCASSHGEKDAASWAVSQGFVVNEQWWHPECRDQLPLPIDLMLYIPVGNALMEVSAVEYDGIHHSDETTYFNQKNLARGGISYVQCHDAIKTNFCLLSHRVLIRVPHTVTGKEAIGEYISGRLVENGLGWWLNDVNGDAA